ncbi:YecA family protein [Bradyrhizobium sp. RDI18]|uniref:YecA family protein n=1 Tax=Bradyrhizobium sp. RDI18 TaxID=3367400 RepID=UPI0037236EB5
MKKEELEAILGDGENTPDLGPIEDHLHAIATEADLPDFSIAVCTARIEEAAPKLRAVLKRAAHGEALSDDESLLLFRGLHILGRARDRESCQPLLRLLRRPFDEVDDLIRDTVSESLANIVTCVFDDDSDALFALIIERSIDGSIREALFGAATFLAWERRIQRDRFRDLLVRFYEERSAEDGDQAWAGWLRAIALLGLRDLVPLVDKVFREDRIPEWIDRSQFDEDLADAESAPDDIDRFTQINLGYIEDVLVSLDWARGSEDDVFEAGDEKSLWPGFAYPSEPIRNPWRNVGRNDPCPCGSGKKFKKCCLAAGGPPA